VGSKSMELCCSVLQCVAVCCSVLQCVAVCCSVLQKDRAVFGVLQISRVPRISVKNLSQKFRALLQKFRRLFWRKIWRLEWFRSLFGLFKNYVICFGFKRNRFLQGGASQIYCLVLLCAVVSYSVLQCAALQCVALRCVALQWVAVGCSC